MRIDIHTHLGVQAKAERELLRAADALAMDRLVVFGAGPVLGDQIAGNSGILAVAKAHPDRLIPFAFFALGKEKPERIDHLIGEGFRGFKFIHPCRPYNLDAFFPIYERIEASGLPALFHTGIVVRTALDALCDVDSTRMDVMGLDRVARAFPKMKIILAHLGNPRHDDAAVLLRVHPNVYADLSGSTLKYRTPEYLGSLLWWGRGDAMYNPSGDTPWKKLLFGSDAVPGMAADIVAETRSAEMDYQRFFDGIGLQEKDRNAIMGDNAARLLGL